MEQVEEVLGTIKGIIQAVTVIAGFAAIFIKPIRQKIKNWITVTAMTPQITESVKELSESVSKLGEQIQDVHTELTNHIKENAVDIKNSNVAQMLTLRQHLQEIYIRNYETKSLTIRESQDIHDIHNAYIALGGNSYAHTIYDEMTTWTIREGI